MARPTLVQYYNYLKEAPRTYGWGAFLVYDRQKANLLLMQEHILRADTEAWIEPVSGEAQTESGKFSRLSNFTFGAPVLSFENSNIGSSMAALSMPVVGGKLTEWVRAAGSSLPTLVGISHLDPLNAPRVKMNIKLNEGKGGVVDEDGRVYLDLSESSAYYFEVSQWGDLNTKLGELIEAQFKEPGRGEQIWELNTLAPVENVLNPTSFRVRTHSLGKAGTPVASTNQADLEEGAVIVGVAFNGDDKGGFPGADGDMPYLLPARAEGGSYSMNVMLSNEVWVKQVFSTLVETMEGVELSEWEYIRDANDFFVEASWGALMFYRRELLHRAEDGQIKGTLWWSVVAPDERLGKFKFTVVDSGVKVEWNVARDAEEIIGRIELWMRGDPNAGLQMSTLHSDIKATCTLSFDPTAPILSLVKGDVQITGEAWTKPYNGAREDKGVLRKFKDSVPTIKAEIVSRIEAAMASILGRIEVVDLLRLNGLIFRNGQRSVMDMLEAPGDISMLGELAPALTTFAIDPIETTLIAGGSQPLTLTPEPRPGTVEWTVKARRDDPENPGGPEQLGEIVDGVYKAPKADTIAGAFRQVIITATVGDNSSSALLTVVPKAVAVRPMLLNALYSNREQPQRYVLEGGSVDSELVWAKGAGFKGDLRDPTAGEYDELKIPRDKQVKVYVAPQRDPDAGQVLGALMQLDQVQVTGGNRTETIDITVLWLPTTATVKVEAQEGGALKLVLAVQRWGGGEQDLLPGDTKWFVAKGKGTLNEAAGIYNPGADEGDYVIIAGVDKNDGNWSYAVLPMPYTSEEAQAFHEVNQAIDGANANAPYTAEQLEAMDAVKKAFSSLSAART
ncbi:hypothetical protein ACIPZC_11085 [Pseudomonas sp. NPDC089743]|uniref:hypothetical protein n=1 Tax=Pseudomonas sp. NPDC089743 TaxID=3364471 RepID=UPI00382F5682